MATAWYVLSTYSGQEGKIEKIIRLKMEKGELSRDIVRDIKIPSEEVVEVKDGKKRTQNRKFLPGYILVEMDLPSNNWKATTSSIKKIEGVSGFLGALGDKKPNPLNSDEARSILQRSREVKGERAARARQTFAAGEQVKIIDGPFASFTGAIEEVNQEKNKLKVTIGIFGRNVPVDVDILQVEKV
uniref:Transcription termination/antitermination protein NusG n=1 Tax=uncultured bacterium contig00033 TaxID=1181522 RepID=A0A806K0A5_9BACT|nr:transcription antitermination protein NusG [uncultured bacterium contig00033]